MPSRMRTDRFLGLRGMSGPARLSIGVVVLGALILLGLLYRTQSNAAEIRELTVQIAESGRGINSYTDSVIQLDRTNKLAASILRSVEPVDENLGGVAALASRIDGSVASIRQSSRSIDGSSASIKKSSVAIRDDVAGLSSTAASINTSLKGVNANAAAILRTAAAIRRGVEAIGTNLAATARITRQILRDARGIDTRLVRTDHLAGCIDNGLNGNAKCEPGGGTK